MTVKLDIDEFVNDYCRGVKDKDLLSKHHINPKELMGIIRKLINDGLITKEQYFDRNRLIQELEAREEKNFLKSLYHCPVCSHIQPSPFTVCPACGTEITKETEPEAEPAKQEKVPSAPENAAAVTVTPVEENPPAPPVAEPAPIPPQPAAVPVPTISAEEQDFPRDVLDLIETPLKEISPIGIHADEITGGNYDVVEVVSHNANSSMFKALDSSGLGPDLNVKLFHIDSLPEESIPDFLDRVLMYQSAMEDSNIVRVFGQAKIDGRDALIYEQMPTSLGALLKDHADGLPLEFLMEILPQILNSVGYSHMHRGRDGVARRLPHMSLRPDKFLFEPDLRQVKLDDCAVWKSLVEVRGFKKHLWEEPVAELTALSPECFVMDSKFVNGFFADIYALGVALYRLATGKLPFMGSNLEEFHFAHLKTFPVPPRVHRWQIPGWLDHMILKCLEKEPSRRWRSATQMELAVGKGFE